MPSLRLVDLDGNEIVKLRPAILGNDAVVCSSFDVGFPAPREVTQERAGYSGNIDLTNFHGPRTVTADMRLRTVDGITKEQSLDLLNAVSTPGNRFYIYLQRDGWSQERRLFARSSALSCISDKQAAAFFTVALSYICPTGVMEATEVSTLTVNPISVSAGIAFGAPADTTPPIIGFVQWQSDTDYPSNGGVAFNPGSSTNKGTVVNEGNTIAPLSFNITGRCSDPKVIISQPGRPTLSMKFTNLTIPDGSTLVVNSENRTVTLEPGGTRVYGNIDWSVSSWLSLYPGENKIEFVSSNVNDNCYLSIIYRERWV